MMRRTRGLASIVRGAAPGAPDLATHVAATAGPPATFVPARGASRIDSMIATGELARL